MAGVGVRSSMPAVTSRSTVRIAVDGMTSRCSPSREMLIGPRLSRTTRVRNCGSVSVSPAAASERADADTSTREAVRTAVTDSSAAASAVRVGSRACSVAGDRAVSWANGHLGMCRFYRLRDGCGRHREVVAQ